MPKETLLNICLSFRPVSVIPTEAEESCHFLIRLKFRGLRSLHCGRDDRGILSLPDTTEVPFNICLSFRHVSVIPTEAEESCHFLILPKFRGLRSLGNSIAVPDAIPPPPSDRQGWPERSKEMLNVTWTEVKKSLMTPGAKGEGVHNEPRRGSLGNEEILGKTRRGSTVGGNVTGAWPEPMELVQEIHNETHSGSLGNKGGSEVQ